MLQSSRYAKPEKFPDRRHLAEEAHDALASLCVSVKAISGPRIRYEERFSFRSDCRVAKKKGTKREMKRLIMIAAAPVIHDQFF